MRVADYIVKFLLDHGIDDIFVLTGYGAMYLNDAIAAEARLKYYCVRNEATSPMMAEAYARVKQSPGAVCLTAGPGSTNAIPGLAEAWVDAAPIIIISGQVHKAHTTFNAKVSGLRSFGTAEINIVSVARSLTKYAVMINDPDSIRFQLEKALYLATSGRPGPVWLDVPLDVQAAEVNPKKLKTFSPPQKRSDKNLETSIKRVIKLLDSSKNPLIVAGQGIRQGKAQKELLKLTKILKVPIIFSRLGVDLLPFSDPHNMGLGGMRGTRFCDLVMKKADVVLVLGSRLAIPFVGQQIEKFSRTAKIICVDIEEAELQKPGVPLFLAINSDVKTFLQMLILQVSKVKLPDYSGWLTYCQKLKNDYPTLTKEMFGDPIDLYYFMSRLDVIATKNHILVTDSGSNYYVGGQVWKFENGQQEITSGTFGSMGLTVPLAIGASIASKKQILAVTGDGSLEVNMQELKTMAYYNLNIKLFVINNGGYVSMRRWQDTYFKGRRIGSDEVTGAQITNLKKIAQAFDLEYDIIKSWKEIDHKLKKIISSRKPIFIEVICDNFQKLIEPIHES